MAHGPLVLFRIDIPVSNSEDPDQTLHSAASELGLHYLPMFQKCVCQSICPC